MLDQTSGCAVRNKKLAGCVPPPPPPPLHPTLALSIRMRSLPGAEESSDPSPLALVAEHTLGLPCPLFFLQSYERRGAWPRQDTALRVSIYERRPCTEWGGVCARCGRLHKGLCAQSPFFRCGGSWTYTCAPNSHELNIGRTRYVTNQPSAKHVDDEHTALLAAGAWLTSQRDKKIRNTTRAILSQKS